MIEKAPAPKDNASEIHLTTVVSKNLKFELELIPSPSPTLGPALCGDIDCGSFSLSAEAQPFLLPEAPYNLDADGDDQACDSLE